MSRIILGVLLLIAGLAAVTFALVVVAGNAIGAVTAPDAVDFSPLIPLVLCSFGGVGGGLYLLFKR